MRPELEKAKAEADKKELVMKARADKKDLRAGADKKELIMRAELENLRNQMQQREMRSQIAESWREPSRGNEGAGCGHHTSLAVSANATSSLRSSNESNGPSWNERSWSAANRAVG
jgi:hypothetical protein